VVTGGPGTGKTTTIQRILAALYHDQKDLQIALVAPTGKAALRMDAARTQLLVTCPDAEIARATTLHRVLGFRPGEDAFARGRGSSLPFDVVVVDEASMVDLELMDALLASLRDDARLLLLGDRNQLSAIGAGQVLRDLCSLARPELGAGRALAARCREWLGMELPVQDRPAPLLDCIVALRTTYRFDDSSGIGAFARAVAMHDDEAALSAMQNSSTDLVLVPHAALESVLRPWLPRFRDQCAASSPHDALLRQQRLRVLCAVNQGPFGKDAVNALVEARLGPRNLDSDGDYQGRPVLITSNDYQTGLMNGDLGVIWPDERGRLLAWFEAPDGFGPRSFLPLRLPPHETAWAMTVHKSQGSEFDHVLVVLPDQNSPLLDAPLLYTAITRAKKTATVIADTAVVQKAIATRETRGSGLCDWLAEADGA
ncbi:MAG: exodeoxyribonuclease V subunit alpha, partial [Planctomycetota bacterium]